MTTPPTTRTERRKAATRQSIVTAAEEIMVEHGADALTLEAVSERADVALQTIYNRVGNRSALLIAVAEHALEESRRYMDAAYATPGTPVERILLAGREYVRFAVEHPHQFRILIDPPNEPEALERIAEITITQNAKLESALRDAISAGVASPEIDPVLAAKALWAAINGIISLGWRADRLRADNDEIMRLLTTFINMSVLSRSVGSSETSAFPTSIF
ncbi:TetR/AcrR family transcriptional regulator [Nocardia salmonicida]|uniref:TetR/AcrR family transcriptional regulator n=1 Tax=Nocardia salmonicida TaxID=53431 RepID=UPI00362E81FD